eukprot:7285692-Prymnesium_polylepis.1
MGSSGLARLSAARPSRPEARLEQPPQKRAPGSPGQDSSRTQNKRRRQAAAPPLLPRARL